MAQTIEEEGELTTTEKLFRIIEIIKKYNCFPCFYSLRNVFFDELIKIYKDSERNLNQLLEIVFKPAELPDFIKEQTKSMILTIKTASEVGAAPLVFSIPIFKGRSVLVYDYRPRPRYAEFFITIRSFDMLTSQIVFDADSEIMKKAVREISAELGFPTIETLPARVREFKKFTKHIPYSFI